MVEGRVSRLIKKGPVKETKSETRAQSGVKNWDDVEKVAPLSPSLNGGKIAIGMFDWKCFY